MSKNKNITDKPNIPITRLKSFDPTITRNNTISKQQFFSTTISDEQQELELSGDDKRCNPSCCELL
ncbi:hypothetical protein [Rickettsia asembonensis]|uniref:Uncharacterized protein n=1 Tax=Rickettsia asembonensis TaxID=1068590 RepID=A0A0C2R8L6_9RICK|nr:hypothetical protein [Rickettsia asembonensis]KIJ88563.1 hypothetical protein SB78_04950 [Rickettsia asembonensis]WCR57315.1 MAG: hypothetical protein PG979_001372 [Rickettsia asembonensis]